MKKLQKYRTWPVIMAVVGVGMTALLPLERVGASSLSATTLETKGQSGVGANNDIHKSQARTLSADGRVSVFSSRATNLVPGSHNGMEQVYAYDRITKKTELVSRIASSVCCVNSCIECEPSPGPTYVWDMILFLQINK